MIWRVRKSEKRFWRVKERRGRRMEMLYVVWGLGSVESEVVGIEISMLGCVCRRIDK